MKKKCGVQSIEVLIKKVTLFEDFGRYMYTILNQYCVEFLRVTN